MDILNPLYFGALLRSAGYYAGRAVRGNRQQMERSARRSELLCAPRRFHARRQFYVDEHLVRIGPARN